MMYVVGLGWIGWTLLELVRLSRQKPALNASPPDSAALLR